MYYQSDEEGCQRLQYYGQQVANEPWTQGRR